MYHVHGLLLLAIVTVGIGGAFLLVTQFASLDSYGLKVDIDELLDMVVDCYLVMRHQEDAGLERIFNENDDDGDGVLSLDVRSKEGWALDECFHAPLTVCE